MGEVAVVTGAAGGIGAAVARRLAAGGARCVLVDRKPEVEHVAASIGGDPIYTMTKHAVIGLVRALAGSLSREGIRISAVCPGLVDTPLTEAARARFQAAGIPMLGADEVAAAIVGLLRDGAPGTELVVSPGKPPTRYFPAALD
jgi:NAD(P)-dependent dehydrogenase (short-subunit alcohol dehydrogenase family)